MFSQLMSSLERLPRSYAGEEAWQRGRPAAVATTACTWARLGPVPMGRLLDLQRRFSRDELMPRSPTELCVLRRISSLAG